MADEDQYLDEMAMLALTDDESAEAAVSERDESEGWHGDLIEAFRRRVIGRAQGLAQMQLSQLQRDSRFQAVADELREQRAVSVAPKLKVGGAALAPPVALRVDAIDGDRITCSWAVAGGKRKSAVFERHALTPAPEGKRGPTRVWFK